MNTSPLEKELVAQFAAYLRVKMPSIHRVNEEWPDANVQLDMPAISIITKKTTYSPYMPVEYNQVTTPVTDPNMPKLTIDMLVGDWDQVLQLDLWAKNKEERSQIFEEFFRAMTPTTPDIPNGISLQLPNYYNVWCRFDIDSYEYLDDEASAQRSERRAMISILSNCPVVRTQVLPVIKTIVVQPQIVDNIVGE